MGRVTAMEYVPAKAGRGSGERLVIRMKATAWWKGAGSEEVRLNTFTYQYPGKRIVGVASRGVC
jgi:hypothetical protein